MTSETRHHAQPVALYWPWLLGELAREREICLHLMPHQLEGHHADVRLAAASLDTGGGAGTHVVAITRTNNRHQIFDNDRRRQFDNLGEQVDLDRWLRRHELSGVHVAAGLELTQQLVGQLVEQI